MKKIILPKIGNTVEEVVIADIYVKVGDTIEVGQLLFEYETDKTIIEFIAEDSGKIIEILIDEGDEVEVPSEVIIIE